MRKTIIALALLASTAIPAYATSDQVKCRTYPVNQIGSVIECVITADKVTISKITANRGNCETASTSWAIAIGIGTELHYGDTAKVVAWCPNVIEFSVEIDGATTTFTPSQGD